MHTYIIILYIYKIVIDLGVKGNCICRKIYFSSSKWELFGLYWAGYPFSGPFLGLPGMGLTHFFSVVEETASPTASDCIHLQWVGSYCERGGLRVTSHAGICSDLSECLSPGTCEKVYTWINELYSSLTPVFTKMSRAPAKAVKPHLALDIEFNLLVRK